MGKEVRLSDLFTEFAMQVPDVAVNDITTHSGNVAAGGLFVACRGYAGHGLDHLDEALAAGPAAVAWEPADDCPAPELPKGVAGVRIDGLGEAVGELADRFFASPSAQLRVTGVTGTNGKTTVAWLASRALQILGRQSAYMGTLGYGLGDKLAGTTLTTPGVIAVHRRLQQLVSQGADSLIMEVSSHGLDQGRVDAVRIRTAVFTNLSRDHLDYHGDLKSYAAAKARLFAMDTLESAVINVGDEHGQDFAATVAEGVDIISVALADRPGAEHARMTAKLVTSGAAGMVLELRGDFGRAELHSTMLGAFNAENLLVAAGILIAHGFSLEAAAAALGQCVAPPGRMQAFRVEGRPLVIVDFAHTPDALGQALLAARAHVEGPVVVVFGCGGDRDQGKRAAMGRVASEHADYVVVTTDNPRSEDPQAIVSDILSGVVNRDSIRVEPDRRIAIRKAIDATDASGLVLIAGKGSEEVQIIGSRAEKFSDAAVATQHMWGLQS